MTTSSHPLITVRNIITFVDDVALATGAELATWFGVDSRYADTMAASAQLVDGGGGTWTIPGDDYRDHLDKLAAAQLDLDVEIKIQPALVPPVDTPSTPAARKLAPPKYPQAKRPAVHPVATLPSDDQVQLFPDDSTPEQRAHAFGATIAPKFQAGPSLTQEPTQAPKAKAKAKAKAEVGTGAYCVVIPRGRSLKYTAQDPNRPGVITHYQGLRLGVTPKVMPTFKWAATDQDPQPVQDAWVKSHQEMEAVITAGGPDVDWYDTYHKAYSRVIKARTRVKKGQAG